MPQLQLARKIDLAHYTFHQRRFPFAVLPDKSDFLSPPDHQVHMRENGMVTVFLFQLLNGNGKGAGTGSGRELEVEPRRINFVDFYTLDLLQLFDTRLYLIGFSGFITKPFDKGFGFLYLLLLVFVGALLLFAAFFSQFDIFRVTHFIIMNMPEHDFDGAVGDGIEEGTVVRHQYKGIATARKKVFEPLNGFDIEMVRRFIQKQDIR